MLLFGNSRIRRVPYLYARRLDWRSLMQECRFNVFGTLIAICGNQGAWRAFYLGAEGKRRPADFIIPDDIEADALCEYLADLFHEEATPRNNTATRISPPAVEA
ncbi:DUF7661 family protein [Janthinobacterium sp. 67]|uniref:DUF7661 family protein n=1 Tax=Janthinobacterium sp. 67 TaxID=2035207 RepID=UPI002FCD7FB6